MGPLGPLPWKVMGHILKSLDNDPGPLNLKACSRDFLLIILILITRMFKSRSTTYDSILEILIQLELFFYKKQMSPPPPFDVKSMSH